MKRVLSYLSSLQCPEVDMRRLQSKQRKLSYLKAEHNSTPLRESFIHLGIKQTDKSVKMELQCTDGMKCRFLFHPYPVCTHKSGLCACAQCAKSNALGRRGPGRQCGSVKHALRFEKEMYTRNYLPTILKLKLGSLLGSFTYDYEGASKEVFSSTRCSQTFWDKSLRSVVLNLSLIFPQWTNVLKIFVYQIACLK